MADLVYIMEMKCSVKQDAFCVVIGSVCVTLHCCIICFLKNILVSRRRETQLQCDNEFYTTEVQ